MVGDSTRALDARSSLLARLDTQLDALNAILAGADDAAIVRRPSPEMWSAHDNVAHIARYHDVLLDRIELITRESAPLVPRYRAEDDPEFPRWRELPTPELLQRLTERRRQVRAAVAALDDAALARIGRHSVFGEMTLRLWIEFFLVHEGHHCYVILQRVRTPAVGGQTR